MIVVIGVVYPIVGLLLGHIYTILTLPGLTGIYDSMYNI